MRNRYQGPFKDHPRSYSDAVIDGMYRGIACYVQDGDTIDVLLDLGLNHAFYVTVRLLDIDTPELSTPEGQLFKTLVQYILPSPSPVLVKTFRDKQTFGRYLANVYYHVPSANEFRDIGIPLKLFNPTTDDPTTFPIV